MHEPARSLEWRFTGRATEYFRIWIVGVALSLLTFGVYSAWAKVRSQQYFYRHTWLDGSSFEYIASPRELLRGRLLFAALLLALFVLQVMFAPAALISLVLLLAITPWVIVRSTAFRAKSSVFRNVPLQLEASLSRAYRVFLGGYASTVASCGFAYPSARWRRVDFIVSGLRYGTASFSWLTSRDAFYSAYLRATLFMLPSIAVAVLAPELPFLVGLPAKIISYGSVLLTSVYLRAVTANLLYGGIHIGPHELRSRQRFWPLCALYVGNTLAVLATLGLAIPWAKVRLARYRVNSLQFLARGPLDVTARLDPSRRRGYGDAAADLGGIDLGIG
jgi:uncharacterized membrane protein YjgN (DUF898 family)